MKKVFMSLAIVALMSAAVACGNNPKKAAEEGETAPEAPATECCDSTCTAACDSCAAACGNCAQEVFEAVEAVAE